MLMADIEKLNQIVISLKHIFKQVVSEIMRDELDSGEVGGQDLLSQGT